MLQPRGELRWEARQLSLNTQGRNLVCEGQAAAAGWHPSEEHCRNVPTDMINTRFTVPTPARTSAALHWLCPEHIQVPRQLGQCNCARSIADAQHGGPPPGHTAGLSDTLVQGAVQRG